LPIGALAAAMGSAKAVKELACHGEVSGGFTGAVRW